MYILLPCIHLTSEEAQQRYEWMRKIHQINRFEMCNFFFPIEKIFDLENVEEAKILKY